MVESIFDDNTHKVGQETEAYCPSSRCKADTTHVITSVYETEIRRVRCLVCSEVHAYRPPRGNLDEEEANEAPLRTRIKNKPTWEEAMRQVADQDLSNCRAYSVFDTYEELDIVMHPTFQIGFITDILPDNKVEITFRDDRRVLVHKRSQEGDKFSKKITEVPIPRETGKRRRKKGEQSKALQQKLESAKKAREKAQELLRSERDKLNKEIATQKLLKTRGGSVRRVGGKKTATVKR